MQSLNKLFEINVTLDGIVIVIKFMQYQKAEANIDVTFDGIMKNGKA